ncbi:endonuclease [Aeromonas phage GomatiRiver_11]|nr:endonuclease II [Aeromonas phage AhFM11]WKW84188.1 endonuclease [Aeromonas phage GomatiRiver_11]
MLKEHGFEKIAELQIGKNGRIDRAFAKKPEYSHLIYAFAIDGVVSYIGQTKNLHKRMDSYANGKYWKNTNPSHIEKSLLLENAIKAGQIVEVWIKHCLKIVFTTPTGSNVVADLDSEEKKYIELFSPPMNSKLKVKKCKNSIPN